MKIKCLLQSNLVYYKIHLRRGSESIWLVARGSVVRSRLSLTTWLSRTRSEEAYICTYTCIVTTRSDTQVPAVELELSASLRTAPQHGTIYTGHSCEFRQFEGAGGSAVLIANFFYKSTHQNKTFCRAITFKIKITLSRIFLRSNFNLFLTNFWKTIARSIFNIFYST